MSDLDSKLAAFATREPEIVFEWHDRETPATGWLVIDSLRGGAAGGGTRMRIGLDRAEVTTLAKTMAIKFTVSGPAIGGAKSGINFDPNDPRKEGVLKRWFEAVRPLLENYYGTGGDLNVDEVRDVIPCLEALGVEHPQAGVLVGHFSPSDGEKREKIARLKRGVLLPVHSTVLTPEPGRFRVADLLTGYGVAESVRHYFDIFGGSVHGKTVALQGWGNVGAATGFYLAARGASVIAITDKEGGIIKESGFSLEEIRTITLTKVGNRLIAPDKLPAEEMAHRLFDIGAEILIPAAASRVIERRHIDSLLRNGVKLIACGANAPFQENAIFYGEEARRLDEQIALIPDFVSNCGMARGFAYLMGDKTDLSERAIFADTSECIKASLSDIHAASAAPYGITRRAFELALGKVGSF